MKKNLSIIQVILVFSSASILFLAGCSGGGGASFVPGTDVINESGGTTDGSGLSSNEQILVENGNIVVNVDHGKLAIDGVDLKLVVQDENGDWILADDVEITVQNNSGETVSGYVVVDPKTGIITFVPDKPLDVSETYTIIVKVGDLVHEATIIVAVDDTGSGDESMFASVTLYDSGSYSLSMADLMSNGKAIFGWKFGETPSVFSIRLGNIEEGAEVYLTAYGIYNIDGHKNEVFYQRWDSGADAGKPVKDYKWAGNTLTVNEVDTTLDTTDVNYSFWSTYIEITIMKDGEDITASSGATLFVN